MDKEYNCESHVNGEIIPITITGWRIEPKPVIPVIEYNGNFLPANEVPNCKISLCEEKATQDCVICLTPICNSHASMATKEHICHYCRLSCWMYEQRKDKS